MENDASQRPEESGPTFVPASGSVIGGMSKDKFGRITEALQDIQLSIDGLRMQLAEANDGARFPTTLATFARSCSMFLRKTVLGDYGKRETRLLDDRVLATTGLRFHRLRKVPQQKRRRIEVGFGLTGGFMAVTKLDDDTLEPEKTYLSRAGPQSLELTIEWPLTGAAGWTSAPSEAAPWLISPDELFRTDIDPDMNCDEWLGQQVVLFDGKGISLKDMIQTVVNFEGAHSISTSRLLTVQDEKPTKAAANSAPHILNAVTVFGVRYAHLIVIETAMCLYDRLIDQDSIERPMGDVYAVKPGVDCSPEQADAEKPDWIRFQGTMIISFSNTPTVIRHEIRAAK